MRVFFFYSKKSTELIHSKRDEISADLIGSWTVQVGDMDQCVHLWRHTGGFEKIDAAQNLFENDNVMTFANTNESAKFSFKLIYSFYAGF